jgi:hypothetical protein
MGVVATVPVPAPFALKVWSKMMVPTWVGTVTGTPVAVAINPLTLAVAWAVMIWEPDVLFQIVE